MATPFFPFRNQEGFILSTLAIFTTEESFRVALILDDISNLNRLVLYRAIPLYPSLCILQI